MRLLIIGGTIFLGRHLVSAARERGHEVTIFHRGTHPATLPDGVSEIFGDRDGDLAAFAGQSWDAVIDTCAYTPRQVRVLLDVFAGQTPHYTLISTISVYDEHFPVGGDESASLVTLDDPATESVTGATYGGLKALCEQIAETAMPGHTLIIRPGLIVGPFDPTDRFTYWPTRVARGGEVLAPGDPDAPVQFIDGRDLAEWTVRLVEAQQVGIYNATGPANKTSLGAFLETCRAVSGSDAQLSWLDEHFVMAAQIAPWTELPLWVPHDDGFAVSTANIDRALMAGLTFRPLTETVRDTLAWEATRPADHEWKAGLSTEREVSALALWHSTPKGFFNS